ncbi:MAG: Dimethyl sulfoxide reductase DmsA [Anaerolineae bacterium]|nr:Dimethyl sulfoxide reductase DmsA [Anaerolineae bacterium]
MKDHSKQWTSNQVEQALACPFTRRNFLKALLAAGALAALPGGMLVPRSSIAEEIFGPTVFQGKDAYQTFRNACPRNCYDTCSIVSYVKDGVLQFIEGAPESTFTNGGLCVKGYAYPRRVYSPDRVKYPMRQVGRGSGNWERISWDEALDIISDKILEIKEKDGSLLGMALTKYSGNFGITHYGVEGMMSSLGYTTRFVGTPCWPAGIDAQNYDMGSMWCNDPEDMVNSKYIIIWGANPAHCSVHSMKFVTEAQRRGAKVVVIDPVFTQTAAKADEYWEIKPSSDGALALGMARYLLDNNLVDRDWIKNNSVGFAEYEAYIKENVTLDWAAEQSGIPVEVFTRVMSEFAAADPATIWIGYGMQRHINGGNNVRAIDALVAMTGNMGKVGGGARYGHLYTWGFNYHAMVQSPPEGSVGFVGESGPKGEFDTGQAATEASYTDRAVNINKIGQVILDTNDPPIRLLWAANKNVLSQDFDRNKIEKAFEKLEMVVVVDQFFTQTAELADIILPTTTLFEDWTVNVSYWHYWLGINEQAIKPLFEAKSDIEIASALSAKLNSKQPGSCTFPENIDTKEWMEKEFNDGIYTLFGIKSWEDLRDGPRKANAGLTPWADGAFATPSQKYEFKSELAAEHGHFDIPKFKPGRDAYAPYRLLTPHDKYSIHSQFQNVDWMHDYNPEPFLYVNPKLARQKGIGEGDTVRLFNQVGELTIKVKLTNNVPADSLLVYENWFGKNNKFNVNNLVDDTSSDMGKYKTGSPGVALHDQFADIEKV